MKKTNNPQTTAGEKPTMSIDELTYRAWILEKKHQLNEWRKASDDGTIKDDENPAFMFQGVWTSLLTKIAKGEISAQFLACQELANRGLDLDGKWIGFEAAEKIHFGEALKAIEKNQINRRQP